MTLDELLAEERIGAFEVRLAQELGSLGGEDSPATLGIVALAAAAVREGHVCLDLSEHTCPTSPLIGGPEDTTPLVRVDDRLYLRRWYEHERTLAERLASRTQPDPLPGASGPILDRLFPGPSPTTPDWQREAARVALERRLTVVAGGPGTGKTTTVVRLLAALNELAGRPLHTRLLAPTGKAAARLEQAVREQRDSIDAPTWVIDAIPTTASTIHRALRAVRGSRVRFRHGPRLPLPDDVIIVDEASMVDIALMRRLVDAVPDQARLVLLGDKDQLASVEAGAVLAELCTLSEAATEDGLAGCVVQLRHSYRFAAGGGIGELATAIRTGDADAALAVLDSSEDVRFVERTDPHTLGTALRDAVRSGYRSLCKASSDRDALGALERFKLLCAHRRGPWGVGRLNGLVERTLRDARLLRPTSRHYPGRPILITTNDYRLRLFNGDQGVVRVLPDGLRACFDSSDDELRRISPARLPPHRTVFAMSIHKSQGSEYDRVAVVLPEADSPLLTRELLYTAVTRARHGVLVAGTRDAVAKAIRTPVSRASGLARALTRP